MPAVNRGFVGRHGGRGPVLEPRFDADRIIVLMGDETIRQLTMGTLTRVTE
jgi:hypothetical protein